MYIQPKQMRLHAAHLDFRWRGLNGSCRLTATDSYTTHMTLKNHLLKRILLLLLLLLCGYVAII